MGSPQSRLDTLLIMAYNVGREHERTGVMTIEEGRVAVLHLKELFDDVDPGDLALPTRSDLR